jgi:hypothetical protein
VKDTLDGLMELALSNTKNSLNNKGEGALFALSRLIRRDNHSRLTTTIIREKFEGYSVDIATIVSSDGTVMPTCFVVWPTT